MRSALLIFLFIISLCLACGGSANGDKWAIEQTIRGYFSTYNACNYEECLTYFTGYGDKEDALPQLAAFRGLSGELTLVRIGGITIELAALVIQNDTGNKFSPTTIVASCSTVAEKSYPFLVPIKAKESGLRKDCTVNLASIMTIEKTRLGDKCGMLNQDKMAEVDKAIKRSLGLDG